VGTCVPTYLKKSPAFKQKGQAILLILLVTVAGALLALSLVNVGILTSEKMQLQNAADATAYSISTLEARDLNFTAYTNRAMVANEVALGQMVGLMSWASMANSSPAWLDLYFSPIYPVPVLGQIIKGVISGLRVVFSTVKNTIKPFTKAGATFIPYFNRVYSTAQRFMHLATAVLTGSTLFDMIDANSKDAQMSAFGYFTLGRHMTTYYSDLNLQKSFGSFVTSYRQDDNWNKLSNGNIPHVPGLTEKPHTSAQKEGMQRLAAMVNAARDPFSKNRECHNHPILGFLCNQSKGGWAIPLLPPIHVNFKVKALGVCILCVKIDFEVNLERKGGSDLRFKTSKKGSKKEQHYVWTAADLTALDVSSSISVEVLDVKLPIPSINFDVPFAIGGAQIASSSDAIKPYPLDKTLWPENGPIGGGKVPDHGYGASPDILPITWSWLFPVPIGEGNVSFQASSNNLNTGYLGLPRYNDTKRSMDPIEISNKMNFGFAAPFLLIGLEKKIGDISQSNSTGRFALSPETAQDKIAVIAKSEVYFSRPSDLSYFARADGATELGNGFNPYWQARLVDTSYLDRTSALAMQQYQPWLPTDVTAVLDQLKSILKSIIG